MTNKTISINPQLFGMSGSKTRKNREKKEKVNVIPLISPNVLKNKLLKRIKEHKQRETENLDNNKRKLSEVSNTASVEPSTDYADEFSESMSYLQTLSKQKKVDEEKANYERKKEQKLKQLQTQTIKNYASSASSISPIINIDLPEELQMVMPQITNTIPITINPPRNDFIPYSNLKGGSKPTYRDWNKTQRANIVTNPNLAVTVNNSTIKSERENRLHNLREKLKMKQLEKTLATQNLAVENINTNIQPPVQTHLATPLTISIPTPEATPVQTPLENEEIIGTKKITKKTIKRKYTLGKSDLKKTVSVLVKDRGTRKQVLSAQKDLKKKSINDIKAYLRDHNLIKVGSNAPNDVLRKLYESAMLAGEITNSNTETLLHNLSKDDKEL
jgi:hypothetical protein